MALFQQSIPDTYLAGYGQLNFYKITFKEFLTELKKKKVKLSLNDEAEWMEQFNEQKAQAEELKSQIAQTDKEIDAMVYELYELSEV